MQKTGMPNLKDRSVEPIGERYLKKIGEPEQLAAHMGKIPGVTHRVSKR